MSVSGTLFYLLLSVGALGWYGYTEYQAQEEFYWTIIALLKKRLTLALLLNLVFALYLASVNCIHSFVFGETREGEKFVGEDMANSGNPAQSETKTLDSVADTSLSVHVVQLLTRTVGGADNDKLDFYLVGCR